MTRRPLRFYQKDGVRYCLDVQHPALFWQMRLGKSLVVVRAEKAKESNQKLIVCPYSAMLSWEEELTLENQPYHIMDGPTNDIVLKTKTHKGRLALLEEMYPNVDYILASKEAHRYTPEIADFSWDALVLDEAHCLKGAPGKSKKTKVPNMVNFFTENFRHVMSRYALTGTPAPESELDYYNVLRYLDHSNWSFKSYWGFKKKLFFQGPDYRTYIKPGAYDKIAKTVAKHCSVLSRHDVNLGGETIEMVRNIKMTPKVKSIYNKVEKEYALEVSGQEKETVWATTKHQWLRRLCGGWADKEFISHGKIKELQYLLSTHFKKEQTVILCHFKKEVKKISKILSKDYRVAFIDGDVPKRKRKQILLDYRNGKLQHLICQHTAIKEGANLSTADIEIFYSLPESGNTWDQVKDRFVDVMYTGSKLILILLCEGTVEPLIYKTLKLKYNRQQKMKQYIRYMRLKWGKIL